MKLLRDNYGSLIERQPEPKRNISPWDCVLDEVSHIAKGIKTKKIQKLRKNKKISREIQARWKDGKSIKDYKKKIQQRKQQNFAQLRDRFNPNTTKSSNKMNNKNNNNNNKRPKKLVFTRMPQLEIAQKLGSYWNNSFKQFDALKRQIIARQDADFKASNYLDGLINLKLDDNNNNSYVFVL